MIFYKNLKTSSYIKRETTSSYRQNKLAAKLLAFCTVGIFFLSITACKKFVEADPPKTQLVRESVFENDQTAIAAQTVIYSQMATSSSLNFSVLPGLSADELTNFSTTSDRTQFYTNGLLANNGQLSLFLWNPPYNYIYEANAILEGLSKSTSISKEIKDQLQGEAKFIRAFWNFYLVNLFADIPLITTTDYKINALAEREGTATIYESIIADLLEARTLLKEQYLGANLILSTNERLRPTRSAAAALLARVYLYKGEWLKSENEATSVINNGQYSLINNLDSSFLKNNLEAIWQITIGLTTLNTPEGSLFILTSTPSTVTISPQLLNSFEPNDKRKALWIKSFTASGKTYYYPFKYKIKTGSPINEYSMVLRLGEQYLIRAEARAQQNKISEAQSDLNLIRKRAGLGNIGANDKSALLTAILHERQVELFTEWGHRWLDLKRTGTIDSVMSIVTPTKGGTWNTNWQLYPVPKYDRDQNKNLTQNLGY
jgi:starch-binding outer membrane protein, SusD/RagB family